MVIPKEIRSLMKRFLLVSIFLFASTNVSAQLVSTPGWHRVASPSYGTAPCGGGSQSNATYMDPINFPNNLNSAYTSYGFNFPGECQSFINDSNGGVLDTTRHRLLLYGGGHSNYWGNDIVSLELTKIGGTTTPMFHLDHSASPVASTICPGTNTGIVTFASGAVCDYRGGGTIAGGSVYGLPRCAYVAGCFPSQITTPGSGHTYQGIVYIPPIYSGGVTYGDEMLNLVSSTSPNGNGSGNAWVLEMSSVPSTCAVTAIAPAGCDPVWTPLGSGPAGNNFYLSPLNVGMVASYDPNAKGVWAQDQNHLQFYDPIAKTMTTKSSNGIGSHSSGVIDPVDNYFIFVGDSLGGPIRYEVLTSPYTIVTPTLTGCSGYANLSNIQYSGAAWDPIAKQVVIYPNQGNVLYRVDPKTWTCTTETFGTSQGVDYPLDTDTHLGGTEGTFGHFQYDPALDVFVMCNLYNDDCWYLVPPRGDPLICNGTWSNGTCSGGTSQTNTPITVSQPFEKGDIPTGTCPLVYQDSSGASTSTTTQTDAKNFWPDGSLKFAMISFIIPSMAAHQVVRAVYRTQACPSNAGFLTKTNMLATTGAPPGVNQNWNFDGQIQLTGTASPHISARTILNAASSCTDPVNGDIENAIISSECVYWLKGPIVTAVILTDGSTSRSQDVNTDGGTGNPLHPIFEAWFWPQTGDVQLGYTLENAWASNTGTKSARDQTFSLVLTAGNTSPVTLSGSWGAASQKMITRSVFHRTYCANGTNIGTQNSCSPVTIDHDYPYLARTLFFPNWDPTLQQNPSYVASLVTAFNAGGTNKGIAGTTAGVGFFPGSNSCGGSNTTSDGDACSAGGFNQTGAAYYHGPLTTWDIVCLLTSDPAECGTVTIGNADLGYEVPYFYREADIGTGHGGWFDAGNANSSTPTAGTVSTFGRVVSINNRTQVNLQSASVNPGCNTTYLNDFVTFGTGGEDAGAFSGNTGTSHWSNLALVSYLFTGQFAYYEEQMMQAAYAIGQAGDYNPTSTRSCYQPTVNGSLRMGAAGYWQVDQERGNDWSGRENALGAFLALDGSPESVYFIDKLKTNLAVWEGIHSIPCDIGPGGTTYSYCTGSGFGASQSAWSYGNTSRVSNSNAGGTTLGSWAIGPAVNDTGGYEIQYPFCFQTTGSGAAGVLNPNLNGGGLTTPVSGPFFQNGDCPTTIPSTPPLGANSFQNAYSTITIGWLNDLGYCPGSCAMLQYVANFWINAAVNPAANPYLLSAYAYPTLDATGAQFPSWTAANASSLYVANGAPTGWIARQGVAGCPSGTSGSADEWYIAENVSAMSYISALTENFSGNSYSGINAYNLVRNADAIQLCFPYFTNTGLVTSPKNFGSPKWDIVPRTVISSGSSGLLLGLIANARAATGTGGLGTNGWAQAGVEGGIPSATWTQCGATVAAGFTSSVVQTQINGCAANTYVLLGPGTTTLTAGLHIFKDRVEVRGTVAADGTLQTILLVPHGIPSAGCQITLVLCVQSGTAFDLVAAPHVDWTGGFAQGSNVLTLSTLSVPGSVGTIAAGQMILVDQCKLGMSGNPCVTPTSNGPDNGNLFDCDDLITTPWSNTHHYTDPLARVTYATTGHWYKVTSSGNPPAIGDVPTDTAFWTDQGAYSLPTFGCSVNGPDGGNIRVNRPQVEEFLITNVNATTNQITLDGTLRHPNWNLASTPEAVPFSVVHYSGFNSIVLDMTNATDGVGGFGTFDAANSWLHNSEVIKGNYAFFFAYLAVHNTIDNNYCYNTTRPTTDSYCVVQTSTDSNLIQNNIHQYSEGLYLGEGSDTGSVFAYNFDINNYDGANNGINESFFPHARDDYELFEGNIAGWYFGENFHGPKDVNTLYRNFWIGWESGANLPVPVAKNSGTIPIHLVASSRQHNILDNVVGNPFYHTSYQGGGDKATFNFGSGNTASSGTVIPNDPVSYSSSYEYGNYDVSNGGETRFCLDVASTNWAALCGGVSEVPTNITVLPQPAPTVGDVARGQGVFPASLIYNSRPAFWNPISLPWPGIGSDISGGNIGICTGTINTTGQYSGVAAMTSTQCSPTTVDLTAWQGHINTNPAMYCYLVVMGGPPDGHNTSVLPFKPSACYSPGSSSPPIASPSNLNLIFSPRATNTTSAPQTFTVSNTGGSNLIFSGPWSTTGDFTANTSDCTDTNPIPPGGFCTFSVTFTPCLVGSRTGLLTMFDNSGGLASSQVVSLSGTGTGMNQGTCSKGVTIIVH